MVSKDLHRLSRLDPSQRLQQARHVVRVVEGGSAAARSAGTAIASILFNASLNGR
jgi:hypothetical protein